MRGSEPFRWLWSGSPLCWFSDGIEGSEEELRRLVRSSGGGWLLEMEGRGVRRNLIHPLLRDSQDRSIPSPHVIPVVECAEVGPSHVLESLRRLVPYVDEASAFIM